MFTGRFSYDQYKIGYIADAIEKEIEKNGRLKTNEEIKEETWRDDDYYKRYSDEKYWYKYYDEVINEFKEAVYLLRKAEIYAHRIDWLLSGYDDEESFLKRLEEDLNKLK